MREETKSGEGSTTSSRVEGSVLGCLGCTVHSASGHVYVHMHTAIHSVRYAYMHIDVCMRCTLSSDYDTYSILDV